MCSIKDNKLINKNLLIRAVAVTALVMITGCVSKDAKTLMSKYATASVNTQKSVMETYRDAIENNKKARLVQAVRDGASLNDLKQLDIDYSGQKKALGDLIAFSESLVTLTSDDVYDKVDESTAELYASAEKLSENEAVNYDATDDLKLFSTLLNASVRGYLEYTRFENAKELVILADKWVQPVVDSLDKDIDRWKNITKRSLQDQKNMTLMILNHPGTYCKIKDPSKKCVPLAETFKTKIELYAEVVQLQKRIGTIDKEFDSLKKSIKALSKLHKKVIVALEDDKINYDSISEDFLAVKTHIKSLKKFKSGLED